MTDAKVRVKTALKQKKPPLYPNLDFRSRGGKGEGRMWVKEWVI
jgi:hypothetical protein